MENKDIIKYIKDYMNKTLCRGAIMLTGEWGKGKSYFIQHELISEIKKDSKKCIVVSLYGLKDIREISKNIYLDLKTQDIQKLWNKKYVDIINNIKNKVNSNNLQIVNTTEFCAAGKTVFNGITSYFGVDLSLKDSDLEKVYNSINLKDKLIILEDIERSEISIIELLGYVNNLVEQDNVKVLLITNESEYLHYAEKEIDDVNIITGIKQKKTILAPTPETEQYLRIKEKTINDTIRFDGNYYAAIEEIIHEYDNFLLDKFSAKTTQEEIVSIMKAFRHFNLRSFIYACQKTIDIFEKLAPHYQKDDEFLRAIFFGNLYYIFKMKKGNELEWGHETYFSKELGNNDSPLFKFCYEYINNQRFNYAIIDATYTKFLEYKKYDASKSIADEDLRILSYYYRAQDKDIHDAVARITNRLKNPNDFSFFVYGNIAVYLIYAKHYLGCEIEEAKKLLVSNLNGEGDKLLPEEVFRIVLGPDATEKMHHEYDELKQDMVKSLKSGQFFIPKFDYLPTQVNIFCDYVKEHKGKIPLHECFAQNLDMYKFKELFSKCSNADKDDLRTAFCSMYDYPGVIQSLGDDLDTIMLLRELLTQEKDEYKEGTIARLQYEWFVENLSEIIENLNMLRRKL